MDYKEALSIIKKDKPGQLIRNCFEYGDKYIFTLSPDDKYIEDDLSLIDYSVDKNTGKIESFDFWGESIQNIFGYKKTDLLESMKNTLEI